MLCILGDQLFGFLYGLYDSLVRFSVTVCYIYWVISCSAFCMASTIRWCGSVLQYVMYTG